VFVLVNERREVMKEVWYVRGADPDSPMPVLFATKMAAEMYARQEFPHADPDERYARIFYKSVWEESDMKEHANATR
jgi:hypothetical protein